MLWQKLWNKGVALTQELGIAGSTSNSSDAPPSRWRENHGNVLVAFVAGVFLLGACVLVYRQNRFVAPRFPESSMITPPPSKGGELASVATKESLTIRVVGAANDEGAVQIAIYDSESSFNNPSNAVISQTVLIHQGEAIWNVPVQLPDKFSIAAFHDENSDKELNRNRLDVPTERYGYSRNARAATARPSFTEAVIERPKAGGSIDIFIR